MTDRINLDDIPGLLAEADRQRDQAHATLRSFLETWEATPRPLTTHDLAQAVRLVTAHQAAAVQVQGYSMLRAVQDLLRRHDS